MRAQQTSGTIPYATNNAIDPETLGNAIAAELLRDGVTMVLVSEQERQKQRIAEMEAQVTRLQGLVRHLDFASAVFTRDIPVSGADLERMYDDYLHPGDLDPIDPAPHAKPDPDGAEAPDPMS